MNNFHRLSDFKNFGKFLIRFRKFDWKSDTRHSSLEFVAKSGQNFIKHSQKILKCKIRWRKWKNKIRNSLLKDSFAKNVDDFWLKFWDLSGAKVCKSCRSRQELSNEYSPMRNCREIFKESENSVFWGPKLISVNLIKMKNASRKLKNALIF